MKYNFIDASGSQQDVDMDVVAYKAAGEAGLSLTQYLQQAYPSDMTRGTTFEQFIQSSGIILNAQPEVGLQPSTMKQVLEGGLELNTGAITRNDGSTNNTVSGRMLFPEIIMQTIQSQLDDNQDDFLGGYQKMIAQTQNVTGPKIDQPVINTQAPRAIASQPISQLAEPAVMVTITVNEKSYRIPTKSIGLTISDEALAATTIDLVGIAVAQQSRQERIRMVEEQLKAMVLGDTDMGETALSSITAVSLDAAVTGNLITQKAWIHYLRDNYRTMTIDTIITDIDTALNIEARVNKPTNQTDDPNSPRIDALFSIENLALPRPNVLLVDTALFGAWGVVGLDSRFAVRRVVNVFAQYSAIEEYVMRRATSLRFDYGEIAHKLYADAWSYMVMTP